MSFTLPYREHVGMDEVANRLRQAIADTLNADNVRTRDLGGHATTRMFTDALIERLGCCTSVGKSSGR